MYLKKTKRIILFSSLFIFCSCSTLFFRNNDISNLPENYFICDSVESTPVLFTLNWEPEEDDSIFIDFFGGPCSAMRYKTGWTKDSEIQIELDAKKESRLYFIFLFGLASYNEHVINYNMYIDETLLVEGECLIKKEPGDKITKHTFYPFLPLYNSVKFKNIAGIRTICRDYPKYDIGFLPEYNESGDPGRSFDVRDYFTISLESCNSKVSLYDKNLRTNVGSEVRANFNDLRKYQVNLLEPYKSDIDDTVSIIYRCNDFVNRHQMIVTKSCQKKKIPIEKIFVKFSKGRADSGDTLDVNLSYLDMDGNEHQFKETTRFEAGLMEGCNFATILNSDGEQKTFFDEIKQPIRIVIADEIPDGESNINLQVGYIPDEDEY